jgi:predicted DNA binding CopG/RHH family protein
MRKPKGTKERTPRGLVIKHLGDADDLTPEQEARAEEATRIADAEDDACRVNFRWEPTQLNLVKAVAAKIGVPYQTYIKMVLYKQALDDWQTINQPGAPSAPAVNYVAESRPMKKKGKAKRLEY